MNILSKSAFWIVNKKLASIVGIEEAILLADFLSKQSYFKSKDELVDGHFFNTSNDIENDTGLSYRKQKRVLKKLTELGVIDSHLIGVPAKLYFSVDETKVLELIGLYEIDTSTKTSNYIDGFTISIEKNKAVDTIYSAYPSRCVVKNSSTGKGIKNKTQIDKLLRTKSTTELLDVIAWYVKECTDSNVYMKNFSTFLNNLPDLPEQESTVEIGKQEEVQKLVRWLAVNYTSKYPDELSTNAVAELTRLGYKNEDFLKQFRL